MSMILIPKYVKTTGKDLVGHQRDNKCPDCSNILYENNTGDFWCGERKCNFYDYKATHDMRNEKYTGDS